MKLNLSEATLTALQEQAARVGQSVEEYVQALLRQRERALRLPTTPDIKRQQTLDALEGLIEDAAPHASVSIRDTLTRWKHAKLEEPS